MLSPLVQHLLSICLGSGSALTAWLSWLMIYRLYFHPLTGFPGPKLAIITYWYEFYYDVVKGAKHTWKIAELHKQYGPIIRINPDELHINDPNYYDTVYAMSKNVDKPLRGAESFGPIPATHGTVKHKLHRIRQAPLNHHFSKKSVADLEPWISMSVEKLCGRFEDACRSGEILNLKYAYAAVARDVIYQYCFSHTLDSVLIPDFDKRYIDVLEQGHHLSPIIMQLHWVGLLLQSLPIWLVKLMNPGFGKLLDEREKVADHIEAIRNGKDKAHEHSQHAIVLHDLLNSNLPPIEKLNNRLRDEAQTLIGAGTSTLAVVFTILTCHLVTNPDKRVELFEELKIAMPDPCTILPFRELEQLPYLTATILEGLRLAHVSSHRLLRSFPDTTLIYDSMKIPPGTTVSMTPILIHDNPDIFAEPSSFQPERWLIADQQRLRRYLVPFAKGTRASLGSNLAWAELYLAIAMIFRRFSFELIDVVKGRDYTVSRDTLIGSMSAESKGVTARIIRSNTHAR